MELLSNLLAIGFTEYEAKAYMALLRESPANGYQISKRSGVPRSMVYEALGRLNARGAVLTTGEERTTLYRPLPPDVLLDRYDQEQRHLIDDLRDGLRKLHEVSDEAHFWSINGRNSALSYAGQMLQRAEKEALLVLNDPALDALRDDIVAVAKRKLSVGTLLTGEGALNSGQVVRHPRRESELQELTDTLVIVTDSNEALIASTATDWTATITRNRNLVLIARQFVWMELFAQRVYTRLGSRLLAKLDPEDQKIFEGYAAG
jgi:sugar-specific transcriptional regulator TrmB